MSRRPRRRLRELGLTGFLHAQLITGGSFAAALVGPSLIAVTVAWLPGVPAVIAIAAATEVAVYVTELALAARRSRQRLRLAELPLVPAYRLLSGVAAWRGLFQLLRRPSHWDKTPHGIAARAGRA
jgi:hypothetical protein